MGLFEFLLERRNPGPVGDLGTDGPGPGPRGDLPTRAFVSAAAIGGWLWVLSESTASTETFWAAVGSSTVYTVVAYFLNPKPDYSNFGLFGGLVDHPCRYTDDINRLLFFLLIVFWPGRFVATAIVDAWRAWRM